MDVSDNGGLLEYLLKVRVCVKIRSKFTLHFRKIKPDSDNILLLEPGPGIAWIRHGFDPYPSSKLLENRFDR